MEFCFLPFFRRFHPANGNLRARNFVPPTIQPARDRVLQNRRLGSEVSQLLLPTLRVAFFRFRHAQKDAFAFLVPLALGEIAIGLRGLDFSLPVAPDHPDRLLCSRRLSELSIFRITRWIFAHIQSAGSNAALIGGSTLALSCCAVITRATEPIMRLAAINVRMVKVSPAKRAPSRTATIGFT